MYLSHTNPEVVYCAASRTDDRLQHDPPVRFFMLACSGVDGSKKRQFCHQHKAEGMVDLATKRRPPL